ncbi:hypothetical protein [Halorhabdus tiamatea]|nr:hypothetical protein [Halorhabdus tiamatea]
MSDLIASLELTEEATPVDREDLVENVIPGTDPDETPFAIEQMDDDIYSIYRQDRGEA